LHVVVLFIPPKLDLLVLGTVREVGALTLTEGQLSPQLVYFQSGVVLGWALAMGRRRVAPLGVLSCVASGTSVWS
jgi:hypothetical protein